MKRTGKKLKVGQRVTLDKSIQNNTVEIIDLSPMQLFAVVRDDSGNKWAVPSERLSDLIN